jgi:hypothetical protein
LCRAVVRILHRAIERQLRSWQRRHGLLHAKGGGVAVIQRFCDAINLNVHVHALVLDGVFVRASTGRLAFHAAPPPAATDAAEILAASARVSIDGTAELIPGLGCSFQVCTILVPELAASGVQARRGRRVVAVDDVDRARASDGANRFEWSRHSQVGQRALAEIPPGQDRPKTIADLGGVQDASRVLGEELIPWTGSGAQARSNRRVIDHMHGARVRNPGAFGGTDHILTRNANREISGASGADDVGAVLMPELVVGGCQPGSRPVLDADRAGVPRAMR